MLNMKRKFSLFDLLGSLFKHRYKKLFKYVNMKTD